MSNDETSQKNLLNVIDFELKKIDDEVTKVGWNFWILLASLASLTWILLEELGKVNQEWKYSLFIFLTLSLLIDLLGNIKSVFTPSFQPQLSNRFFIASDLFRSSRMLYLFALLRNFILISIVYFTRDEIVYYEVLLWFYILYNLNILFIFISSFLDTPLRYKSNLTNNLLKLLVVLVNLFFVVYMLFQILCGQILINISDYKIGSILFGLSFLLSHVIAINQNTHQKYLLSNIRRDYLLGNIKFDDAKRQTEILLLGMQTDDFMRPDINSWLEKFQDLSNIANRVETRYANLQGNTTLGKIKKMKASEINNFLSSLEEAVKLTKGDLNDANKILQDTKIISGRISKKKSLLGKDTNLSDELSSQINIRGRESVEKLDQMRRRLEDINKFAEVAFSRQRYLIKNKS